MLDLDLDLPAQPAPPAPYRVLARKYRPADFAALIGQEAMVRTLGNAFARGQLAHAWLLSGVRGVGKTSTARIIAKSLNCIGPDGQGGPTVQPCGVCSNCVAIAAGRHIDVIEMDAASNTGVDKMRELLDGVPYGTVQARFRVYIVDEVHMLSNSAFNALLKTLEEPPPHIKFIFATTEVQKLPVTVLSRCQRFDLRRVPLDRLQTHFAGIADAEGVIVEPLALQYIAEAADGSVRDGLSILDQAIAHGAGTVSAADVRDMLGLADRTATARLFDLLVAGDGAAASAALRAQHDLGVEPLAIVRALLHRTHALTLAKLGIELPAGDGAPASAALSHARLHRLWQLLLRAHGEVLEAPNPLEATEMAVLRVAHSAGMPDPEELMRRLRGDPSAEAPPAPAPSEPNGEHAAFAALIPELEAAGEALLAKQLHDDARLIRYAPPLLHIAPAGPLPVDFAARLTRALGGRLRVTVERTGGGPTLREHELAAAAAARATAEADPQVAALLAAFPGAELVSVEAA